MRFHQMTLATALLLLSLIAGAADSTAEIDAEISRYLEVIKFVPSTRQGFERARGTPVGDAVLAASDKQLVEAVTPVFRSYVNLEEMRELVKFFTSQTATVITREQMSGNPQPLQALTPEQRAEFDRFTRSKGGAAAQRLTNALQNPEFWDKVNAALARLPKTSNP